MKLEAALPIDDDEERLLPAEAYYDVALEGPTSRRRANTVLYDCENPAIASRAWYANWRDTTKLKPGITNTWLNFRSMTCTLSFGVVFIIAVLTFRDLMHKNGQTQDSFRVSEASQLRNSPAPTRFSWVLTESFSTVLNRTILTTNGMMPGPMLEGFVHASISIKVTNKLPMPVAIHWHGISQNGSNSQDGVPTITQSPILPGHTFEYKFEMDQAGTFWWHAHADMSRLDGLYGAFIVHPSERDFALGAIASTDITDHVLMVSDWYDASSQTYRSQYLSPSNVDLQEPLPTHIMTNGVLSRGGSRMMYALPRGEPKTRYLRLRMINVGAFAEIKIAAPRRAGTFIVIEADSTPIMPIEVTSLNIAVGQRYSLVVDTDDYTATEDINLEIEMDLQSHFGDSPSPVPGGHQAVHHGHHHRDLSGTITSLNANTSGSTMKPTHLHDGMLHSPINTTTYNTTSDALRNADVPFFTLDLGMQRDNGTTRSTINNTTYVAQDYPIIQDFATLSMDGRTGLSHKYSPDTLTLSIAAGEEVTLLITASGGGNHPVHVHGHRLTLLASNSFFFDPLTQKRISRPFDRDTVASVKYSAVHGTSRERSIARDTINVEDGGWSLVSLRGTGKGVWFMHCHSAWHESSGMAMVLEVR